MTANQPFPAHIFFAGIGGIGVSALAQVALSRGSKVSGSDLHAQPDSNPAIARLQAAGATIYEGHHADSLSPDTDLVVASAAIASTSPELVAARNLGVPIISRAQFLGTLMAAHHGCSVAVAGTHGKTTTTSMAGVSLSLAGLQPTVFVGGEVPQLGGNVTTGPSTTPFVAEACEAYDSFLWLVPDIAVITNIEPDHLDHFGTFEHMMESFGKFASATLAKGGCLVLCRDDAGVNALAATLPDNSSIYWYGIDDVTDLELGAETSFVWRGYRIRLSALGTHNVSNALAVLTLADLIPGAKLDDMISGIQKFHGVNRRQQQLGTIAVGGGQVTILDDYAHHPTEIATTLAALNNAYPKRRLVLVFQPHLYSRTRDFLHEFAEVLKKPDVLVLAPIYAAREQDPGDISSAVLADLVQCSSARSNVHVAKEMNDVLPIVKNLLHPGDLLVFMGAGDVFQLAHQLVR